MTKHLHPSWYYSLYDSVFAGCRDYAREIELISTKCTISGSTVREIGAGTGKHSELILARSPSKLQLVDIDDQAIRILEHKFSGHENVDIVHADGFSPNGILNGHQHLVIAMFSIIQQVASFDSFIERLANVINSLAQDGIFAFEYIDYDVNRSIYEGYSRTIVLHNDNVQIFVESSFQDLITTVTYSGKIGCAPIKYSVDLLNVTQRDIDCFVGGLQHSCSHLNISMHGRRKICFISGLLHGS